MSTDYTAITETVDRAERLAEDGATVGARMLLLEARGMIDAALHHPQEKKNVTTVTVDGLNGVDDDVPGGALYEAVVAKRDGRPAPTSDEFARMLALSFAIGQYNDLRTRLAVEEEARAERNRVLDLVDERWDALADPNSGGSWLHGHHAYIVAVDNAHRAIDAWRATAESLRKAASFRRGEDVDRLVDAYEQRILPAGYPPASKPDIDAEAEAARLHEELNAKHTCRKALAAETLALADQH